MVLVDTEVDLNSRQFLAVIVTNKPKKNHNNYILLQHEIQRSG